MRFIATIAVIAFSGAIICSPDFGSHATRTANTNFVRPQSNSGSFLPTVGTQQPLKKSQIFQAATNSQQNNITNYRVQRPSSSTHLSPQPSLYSFITSRPLRSILRIGKQLGRSTGIGGIEEDKAPAALPILPEIHNGLGGGTGEITRIGFPLIGPLDGRTGIGGVGKDKAPTAPPIPLEPPSGICSSILIAATRMDLCG